jgi:UDP-N-acetylmuramate--alanine ligase
VYNSLAAVCVGLELQMEFSKIKAGLESFAGVQRRMQKKGEIDEITVVDDYGHHPTEIRATLGAIKQAWPDKRLVVLFQPHRYTRTKALFREFQTCFHQADLLVMTEIYAASEQPMEGVSGEKLLVAAKKHGQKRVLYIKDVDTMARELLPHLEKGDLVLTLGAGNIVNVGEELLTILGG